MILDVGGPEPTKAEVLAALDKAEHGSDALNVMIGRYVGAVIAPPLDYTGSIDAALTLVPDGWRDDISIEIADGPNARYVMTSPDGRRKPLWDKPNCVALANGDINKPGTKQVVAKAWTGPIAVCIAAMQARS